MTVEEICSSHVISAPGSCTLERAAILMRDHHVGALLVTEDEPEEDRAIGVVTDRDMVLLAMAEGLDPRKCTVAEVMTPTLATVSMGQSMREAIDIMRNHGVRRLGVTDDDGELVGVLSIDDILATLGSDFGALADIVLTGQEHEAIKR